MTEVATELMGVDSATVVAAYESVLRTLTVYFALDATFLRHTDSARGTTVLVAEWPPRVGVAEPDPLHGIDASTASRMTEPVVVRNESGSRGASTAVVPLVGPAHALGILGFVRSGNRAWPEAELGALMAIAALLAQLHARVAAEERMRFAALHDDLTGLANRKAVLGHLDRRLASTEPGPVAVLFLDVDRLETINDFLGHDAGDTFITEVSARLQNRLSSTSLVARLGGDEFVVVLAGPHSARDAEIEARRALTVVREQVRLGIERVSRSASIGITVGMPGRAIPDEILSQAEQAARAAKAAGGNGLAHYNEKMRARTELRNDIEIHLRTAIVDDSLILHYQPEVDLVTGAITAFEALVRWNHPTRGLLPPSAFIPVAEATNLAGELGRWVLRTACATFASWRSQIPTLDVEMRVNVSPVQLVTDDFATIVADALRTYGMDGPSLCIEITEVAVVQDLARTRLTLLGLRDLGVRVAIDDFGTGYSSLSHLKELPVDTLKIDRAFVTNLGSADTDDLAIIEAITGLARSFGLDVVAEGVETPVARGTLVELGCRRAQGYLMSRPVPADEALELVRGSTIDI